MYILISSLAFSVPALAVRILLRVVRILLPYVQAYV
jgi:hypothetical protein